MNRGSRKLALTAHLTISIGWLGAVIAFLALAIAGVRSPVPETIRAACVAMGLLVSYVIAPLAFSSLVSGLVSALATPWGLLRYHWVLVKLLLTSVAVIVLLIQLRPIRPLADLAGGGGVSLEVLQDLSKRPLIHPAGGLLVLLTVQVLGVYKPWGKTRYGRRGEQESGGR